MVELSEETKNRFKDVFKRQLKYYRTEIFRCSQERAAAKLNVSIQHYKNLEYGIEMPSTKLLIFMAEEYGFRVDYLFLYLLNDTKGEKKSQDQLVLEQINNTCSDSERRALIYHWNMYMNPKNKSGFNIVEDPSFTSESDIPSKQKSRKSQTD